VALLGTSTCPKEHNVCQYTRNDPPYTGTDWIGLDWIGLDWQLYLRCAGLVASLFTKFRPYGEEHIKSFTIQASKPNDKRSSKRLLAVGNRRFFLIKRNALGKKSVCVRWHGMLHSCLALVRRVAYHPTCHVFVGNTQCTLL
jgi:hypothetical protein